MRRFREYDSFSRMTLVVFFFFAFFFLLALAAHGQGLQCSINGVACQPGSQGCAQGLPGAVCVQEAPPVVVTPPPPACPYGTYLTAYGCTPVPQTYNYIPPPVYYPQPQPQYHNPMWNVPFNQQPGWPHQH